MMHLNFFKESQRNKPNVHSLVQNDYQCFRLAPHFDSQLFNVKTKAQVKVQNVPLSKKVAISHHIQEKVWFCSSTVLLLFCFVPEVH